MKTPTAGVDQALDQGFALAYVRGMIYPPTITTQNLLVAPVSDEAEWDAFVENAPGATFSHFSGWRDIIAGVMGHEVCYLAAWDADGSIRGALPLVRLKSAFFGVRHVSVPYLNDGGPVGEQAAVTALRERALAIVAESGGQLELRVREPWPGAEQRCRKVTVLLDLPQHADELWTSLPAKVRSQIKRPQKAGMTARFGLDQVEAFYDVWSRNMRDLGTPALPRRFFEAAAAAFPDRLVVGCVYHEGRAVAAGAGFAFRDEFEITWASALREYSRAAPNMLLYWEFMQRAMERGAKKFNFGRCTPGGGTHRFKLQWGGDTVPLAWQTFGNGAETGAGGPGRMARIASAAWQRLPLSVANALGPVVARQLPWW